MEEARKALVEELHKPARRNFLRRKVVMRGLDESWQADLVEMQAYSHQNKGYRYLLTVIDNLSKYAWAVPIRSKSGADVTKAMKTILDEGRVPINLQVDEGKEFYNKEFQKLMQQYKINLYSTYSPLKASICERFNRTLKSKMWKQFSLRGSHKWLDILPTLMAEYNNTKHRTIGMKPIQVNSTNASEVLAKFQKPENARRPKFQVGDNVRISKYKHIFEKGYTPNYTTEIFTVEKVQPTVPYTYKLKDYKGEKIAGGFYEFELLKVKNPDVYLVEKVLRKKNGKLLVKWLGFDKSHNSWISSTDL